MCSRPYVCIHKGLTPRYAALRLCNYVMKCYTIVRIHIYIYSTSYKGRGSLSCDFSCTSSLSLLNLNCMSILKYYNSLYFCIRFLFILFFFYYIITPIINDSPTYAPERLYSCIKSIHQWLTSNSLKLNPTKTEAIFLHLPLRSSTLPEPPPSHSTIPHSPTLNMSETLDSILIPPFPLTIILYTCINPSTTTYAASA